MVFEFILTVKTWFLSLYRIRNPQRKASVPKNPSQALDFVQSSFSSCGFIYVYGLMIKRLFFLSNTVVQDAW